MSVNDVYLGQAKITSFCYKENIQIYVTLQAGEVRLKKKLLIMMFLTNKLEAGAWGNMSSKQRQLDFQLGLEAESYLIRIRHTHKHEIE